MRHNVYWRDTAPASVRPCLPGDLECDIVIVGAGYTGLWTAYFLQEADPSLAIVIAEADHVGAGASGHNDGFVLQALGGHSAVTLAREFGADRTTRLAAALARSAAGLARACIRHQLDAEFEASSIYTVATNAYQRRRLERSAALAERLGPASQPVLSGAQARAHVGLPAIVAGHRVGGGLVNPYKLARALAGLVCARGARLCERTPVTSLRETKDGVVATTPHGRVRAGKAVLATDAYQDWHAAFGRQVRHVRSYALVTAPLRDEAAQRLHWPGRAGFIDGRHTSVFGRLTWDNRILLAGGFAHACHAADPGALEIPSPRTIRRMLSLFRHFFPMLGGTPVEYCYSGIVGITPERLPHVGSLSPRVAYAYGYCGHGIVVSHTAAQALAALLLGLPGEHRDLLAVAGAGRQFGAEPLGSLRLRTAMARRAMSDWYHDRVPYQPLASLTAQTARKAGPG